MYFIIYNILLAFCIAFLCDLSPINESELLLNPTAMLIIDLHILKDYNTQKYLH